MIHQPLHVLSFATSNNRVTIIYSTSNVFGVIWSSLTSN
jgi:hypothetical protein